MKIKDIFNIGPIVTMGRRGLSYLNRGSGQIFNKTLNDDQVSLRLRRESDGIEGDSSLKVKDEFKERRKELLSWAFNSKEMIGLTLDELDNMETNLEIEKFNGRIQVK